ncbi:MAG TPA: hypothetical protein VFK80_03290, partial [Limnochordia bacterium]|nr:hypothetical protein [Limnochordia bacterium]
ASSNKRNVYTRYGEKELYVLPHCVQAKALLDQAVAERIWSQNQSVAGAVAEIKPPMHKLFADAGQG